MNKIRFDDHISRLQEDGWKDIDARKQRLADLQKQAHEALARNSAVKAEVERCTRIRDDLTSAGLPTTAVEQKVDELKDSCTKLQLEVTTLEELIAAAKRDVDSYVPVVTEVARGLLAKKGIVWMLEVESLAELVDHLPIKFPKIDKLGLPSKASFDLGDGSSLEVPVETGTRVLKGTVPDSLSWLPRAILEEGTEMATDDSGPAIGLECHEASDPLEAIVVRCGDERTLRFLAVRDRSSNVFLLSRTQWHVPQERAKQVVYTHTYDESPRMKLVDVASYGQFEELHVRLRNELPPEGAPVRADTTYEPGSVAWAVQQRLLAATVEPQSFRECKHYLRSPDIERILEPHWKAFVRCRWHAGVAGDLALLKHLAEMGEKPKLWNARIEGHYGFRMRTRDHDWLVGELFVFPEDDTEPSDPEWMDVYTESGWSSTTGRVAVVGRLALRVVREK